MPRRERPDALTSSNPHRPPEAHRDLAVNRRPVIAGAGTGLALRTIGFQTPPTRAAPGGVGDPQRVSITASGIPQGAPLRAADFGLVGVFDVDWLLSPQYTCLLDNFAASPGAFTGVRFFGALNSGEREDTLP